MAPLIAQEIGFPGDVSQGQGKADGDSKNITKVVYIAIGMVAFIVILLILFSGGGNKEYDSYSEYNGLSSGQDSLSGSDAKTSSSANKTSVSACVLPKNCLNSPKICKCGLGEYCSKNTAKCVKPVCGNQKCEEGEYVDTCCEDCGCANAGCEICNNETHKCSASESKVTDADAIAAVQGYLSSQGVIAENISVQGNFCENSDLLKYVLVSALDYESPREFSVSESMEVSPVFRL